LLGDLSGTNGSDVRLTSSQKKAQASYAANTSSIGDMSNAADDTRSATTRNECRQQTSDLPIRNKSK
jgi:hypothetical protein